MSARHVALAVGACAALVAGGALVVACGPFSGEEPAPLAPDANAPDAATTDAFAPASDGGAADAAARADAAASACAAQPFSDGFEGAALDAAWTESGTSDIDFLLSPDRKASGAQALRVTVQTAPTDHGRKLVRPIPGKCVDVQWAMVVPSAFIPDGTTVIAIALGSGDQLVAFVNGTQLVIAEQGTGKPRSSLGVLPLPTTDFATFHLQLQPGKATGLQATVAISTGSAAVLRSTSLPFEDMPTASLAIGAPLVPAGKTGELWLDDVVVR